MISPAGRAKGNPGGFTYIFLLVAVVVLGITAQVAVTLTSHQVQRSREQELMFRGMAYKQAIKYYYNAVPPPKVFPRNFDQLMEDRRFPTPKKHIRALYSDPVSSGNDWTIIHASDGGIQGVASSSDDKPIKQANFPRGLETFEGADSYSQWVFEYSPTVAKQKPK